jgi:hypothetical protein
VTEAGGALATLQFRWVVGNTPTFYNQSKNKRPPTKIERLNDDNPLSFLER